jgi:hypothetical protein
MAFMFMAACAAGFAQEPSPSMYLMGVTTGTARNPSAWPMPMHMQREGSWRFMFMGEAFVIDTQEAKPRGSGKFYSTNWMMASAAHSLLGGTLMLETMLSLEPATVTNRSYPELFQTGETAYGRSLVDAQHPHDLVMGLGVHYAHRIGEKAMAHLYYAPVGDPALGPVAFPHRASALEIPQAPLGHHWEDSTHVADNVTTAGIQYRSVRLEASGFYGTEPDENRWNVDWGPMNSYSVRASFSPNDKWSAQVSSGLLRRPERQQPGDVVRTTASVSYSRPMRGTAWSSSLIWGRNHEKLTGHNLNAYLAETLYPVRRKDFITARIEVVDKDELMTGTVPQARIKAYTAGYTRDIGTFGNVATGIGMNATGYAIPDSIRPYYGDHPWGVDVFLRFRLAR